MTRKQKLIYIAGFFDGEGCITFTRHEHTSSLSFGLKVVLTQNDPAPLREIENYFGFGKVYKLAQPKSRFVFQWSVTGKKALIILEALLPYLVIKKDQAILAIQYQKAPWRGNRQGHNHHHEDKLVVEQIRSLKHIRYVN